MPSHQYSFARRLIRSILPSPMSGLLCLFFGVFAVLAYLVIVSVSDGTALPELFEGELGATYTNNIVRPILSAFSNLTIGRVFVLLLWGTMGFCVYLVVEYTVRLYRSWHEARHNIQLADRSVIPHPGLSLFLLAAAWRIAVLTMFSVILVLGTASILHQLSVLAPDMVRGTIGMADTVKQLLLLAGKLAIAAHVFVVFLRLFLTRTRLFGNDMSIHRTR